jgi:hypothetical protein
MSKNLKRIKPNQTKVYKMSKWFQNSIKALPIPINGDIAIFINNEVVDNKTIGFLVFAPIDSQGNPILDSTVSLELPCPPYCTRGTGNVTAAVVTEDEGGNP